MVYMYHRFLIHSSADGHLGFFHVLAIINSAAMSIGVHVSLSDLVSLVCMPRSGIAGSYVMPDYFYIMVLSIQFIAWSLPEHTFKWYLHFFIFLITFPRIIWGQAQRTDLRKGSAKAQGACTSWPEDTRPMCFLLGVSVRG